VEGDNLLFVGNVPGFWQFSGNKALSLQKGACSSVKKKYFLSNYIFNACHKISIVEVKCKLNCALVYDKMKAQGKGRGKLLVLYIEIMGRFSYNFISIIIAWSLHGKSN
jgi:hypothetical protein